LIWFCTENHSSPSRGYFKYINLITKSSSWCFLVDWGSRLHNSHCIW
jgi:hypothetical protein